MSWGLITQLSGTQIFYLIIVFLTSAFLSYMDIDAEFRSRKIRIIPLYKHWHWPTIVFLIANGLASVVILAWAYLSGDDSAINRVITGDIEKAFFIGLGWPILLRSHITRLGGKDGEILVGLEGIYQYIRVEVLASFNQFSGRYKIKAVTELADKHLNNGDIKSIVDDLKNLVNDDFRIRDVSREERKISHDQMENLLKPIVDLSKTDKNDFRKIIKWAMDAMGVQPVINYFKDK